jgi:DNA polymerase I-like protein with 3'-5' exonuclease and polymerase domains
MFATADIVPVGVVYLWHLMRAAELESFLINTVHDSAIAEIKPEEQEIFTELSSYAMTNCVVSYLKEVYNIDFNVPLECEAEFNSNWADSEEWRSTWLQ